ncbi:histidine phosphatase family protein [Mesobacillus zeae]|uniref:Histidine phosphatase family protein n=1 Tax=Mesobacillus zeae TaxID=1917180 RepID=A0A398BJD3_9BACI|nr:histidine phosphatase family protein [Mesobacillus zeae]RID87503.1 histidine phosphatase family protein [Mesobacillus zeae]
MEISLIRHGRSLCTDRGRVTCREFHNWVKRYDDSGVFPEEVYPASARHALRLANVVLTSDYSRAIESAALLGDHDRVIPDPIFREAELPSPMLHLLQLKLRPNTWAVILRCLWLSGYSKGCESLKKARQRAETAAHLLAGYAEEYQSVTLVGHGFFNRLVAEELMKTGWKGRKSVGKHWNCTTLRYEDFSRG